MSEIEKDSTSEDRKIEDGHLDDTKRSFRHDAVEAENAEHSMTVWEACKSYPMACFWAFVVSFTIVSHVLSATRTLG
jgi:SP family general alpha glucoside:H+ symporter-like MFS transporter